MARYYVDTREGRKGPYTPKQISVGIQRGLIPLGARVTDEYTGAIHKAAEVANDGSPNDSGSQPAVSPQGSPPAPRNTGMQQARTTPQQRPRPMQQQAYPQQQQYPPQQQQYPPQQQAYPPQQQYPQQYNAGGAYPYNAQQQAYPAHYPYGQQQVYVPTRTETSGWAVASLICSLITFGVCLPTWILGIIFGIMGLRECAPNGHKQGRGLAMSGLIIGAIIGVIYVLFIALIIFDASTSPYYY
jgi:hypothetical protein